MFLFFLKDIFIDIIKANKYSLLFLYMIFYLVIHPRKAFLQYHESRRGCVEKMASLHQKYKTIFITEFGILQSYLQLHRFVDPIERECFRIRVPYNGEIILDKVKEDKHYLRNIITNNKNIKDVKIDNIENENIKNVLLVHGFNGSSNSKYIIALSHHLKKAGCRIFCFNARGTKETLNNSIFFHIGWTIDLKVAVEFILHNYKGTVEIYGFSMGGSWVTKFFGEEKNLNSRIIKGGAICLPFDFYKIENWMSKKRKFLNRILTYNFCKYIRRNKEIFKDSVDLDQVLKSKNLRDIDTLLTKKVFNFTCINNYYKTESCVHYLKSIRIPFLILNSKDDPIIPEFVIDKDECLKNPNILLVINPWGGHLGFLKNSLRHSLADEIILDFSEHFK